MADHPTGKTYNPKCSKIQNFLSTKRRLKMFWRLEHFRFQNQLRHDKYPGTGRPSDISTTSDAKHFDKGCSACIKSITE